MGFNAKAFGAAFATELAGGIKARTAEAKEFKEKKEELAQRNLPVFQKRTQQKDVLLGYARTLKKMGATPKQIMYYMRLGPSSFQTLHKHIIKKASDFKKATNGTELSALAIQKMMEMPEEFEGTIQEQGFEEFLNKAYRLSSENDTFEAPVTEEISAGNLLKGMLGIGAKDRMKQKLRTEKFLGDLSVEQINRVAAQQDFLDPYGGQDMPTLDLTTGPVIIDLKTQELVQNSATSKFALATNSVPKTTALVTSYINKNGIVLDDKDRKLPIAKALATEDLKGLSDQEKQIYNEVRDKAEFDAFKEAAGGRVGGDTVKFFEPRIQELFDKFESPVGGSDTGADKGQDTTTANFASKAEFNEAILAKQIVADKEYTYMQNGVLKTKTFTQEDVAAFYKVDETKKKVMEVNDAVLIPEDRLLTEEEFNELTDNPNPPGTALTPSGSIKDARDAFFENIRDAYRKTGGLLTSGFKKRSYEEYKKNYLARQGKA